MIQLDQLFKLIDESVEDRLEQVYTTLPGYVTSFNPKTGMAQVQPGIKRKWKDEIITPAIIVEVPVCIFGSQDFYVEYEIKEGTEGLLHFSQRSIDAWSQTGGVAEKLSDRVFDETDAFFAPGYHSLKNAPQDYKNNGIRLRNKVGDKYIWLKNDGTAEITVDTLVINGNISHNGDQTTSGTITGETDVIFDGISAKTHKHDGVEVGGGTTGEPI